jgi:hypothetical protein
VQYTRIAAATVASVSSVVLVATLSGCASVPSSSLTVPTAKAQTIIFEQQIAAYVPAADVKTMSYTKTSRVIFPCLGKKNESYWPGALTVNLKPATDTDTILTAMAANWTNKSGWSVFKVNAADGNPSLDIKSDAGYSFTVEFDQGPVLSINALSACFSNVGLAGKSSY